MRYQKKSLIYRIIFTCFTFLVTLTMFLPTISLDKYVEYDFTNGYYNESYESHIDPIATNISPYFFIKSLFTKRTDFALIAAEYREVKQELDASLQAGNITETEYNLQLAKAPETGDYYVHAIKFGSIKELNRLSDKVFMFSCVITAFYAVTIIMLIVNFINIFIKKKVLSIANVYGGWTQTVLFLIIQLFTFGFAISSQNVIENIVKDTLTEEITYAASPKFLSILILCALIIYSTIAMILDKKNTKLEKQNKEIPAYIANKIQNNNHHNNKYRKINSKKSKYKHGYKKKHHH